MNENNGNGGWWFAFVVLVVACIIAAGVKHHKEEAMMMQPIDQGASTTVMSGDQTASGVVATEDVSTGDVTAATPGAAPLSYEQALAKYADARIQFDSACQATPSASTFRNGTLIMLDNRSADTRDIHLGSLGDISIKPWGFKLVQLSSSLLPNALAIDCGTNQNVSIITVQK